MNYIHYAFNILLFGITFYSFTPGILFTIPAGSSKKVVALVHTLLWTVFITLFYYFFVYNLGLVVVPLFGIVFFIFSSATKIGCLPATYKSSRSSLYLSLLNL